MHVYIFSMGNSNYWYYIGSDHYEVLFINLRYKYALQIQCSLAQNNDYELLIPETPLPIDFGLLTFI